MSGSASALLYERFGVGRGREEQVNRMKMSYSSANTSEEESSTLINVLDRKKYNEMVSANKSAEEGF
jgi:hypothetical protein